MKMSESLKEGALSSPSNPSASTTSLSASSETPAAASAVAAATASLPSTISEEEKELASTSLREFEASKFKDCLTVLNRLANLRPNDNKVKQNKAVAEYVGGGLKFSETYLTTLNVVRNDDRG